MSALRGAHAAFVFAAFITGCYQSHGIEDCADGPYGFSRCVFQGELSIEQERALCAWEASIFEPAPDVVTCRGFNVRYRDFDACLAAERFVMEDCEKPVGVWEHCTRRLVERPCDHLEPSNLAVCQVPGCFVP